MDTASQRAASYRLGARAKHGKAPAPCSNIDDLNVRRDSRYALSVAVAGRLCAARSWRTSRRSRPVPIEYVSPGAPAVSGLQLRQRHDLYSGHAVPFRDMALARCRSRGGSSVRQSGGIRQSTEYPGGIEVQRRYPGQSGYGLRRRR